jgi:choline dehydrogenase-like flavoprotein
MYLDANQIPNGAVLGGFDICIVGAGAAGIAMAARLAATDKKVLVITSGSSTGRYAPSPSDQILYAGQVGSFMQKVDPSFLTRSRQRMYGGTTNHFGYWARPLERVDLLPRPGYRDAAWPIDIKELDAYYPAANDTGQFGPFNYDDVAFWADALGGQPFPAVPGDALQNAIFHAQYTDNVRQFQVQFQPILEPSSNVTLVYNGNVLTLDSIGSSMRHVASVRCASLLNGTPNRRFRIDCPTYVLAQGGIEVVRLLKLSGDLGNNARGQLGRGFMVHPLITDAAAVTFSRPIDTLVRNFFREQLVTIPSRATAEQLRPITGPIFHPEELRDLYRLTAWGVLTPTPQAMDGERIGNFRLILRFQSSTFTSVDINWEQVPNENSTIMLDPGVRDPIFDQPVVRLDWNLLEPDKRTVQRGLDLCRQYLLARDPGARFNVTTDLSGGPDHWTFTPNSPNRLQAGDHHMGATRMSRTAADGIVNPDLRLHGVDNLYVASCSVFPTSGYANPTLTLEALATRLADHLKQQRA